MMFGKAVRKKAIEGIIPEAEEEKIREKIENLISRPVIKEWFEKGNKVLNEASILMPDVSDKTARQDNTEGWRSNHN